MKNLTQRFIYFIFAFLFISPVFVESVSARSVKTDTENHRVKIWIKSFIPYDKIELWPFRVCFSGDNRTFSEAIDASCRTHQEIEFDITTRNLVNENSSTGHTHLINCRTNNILVSAQAKRDGLKNGPVTMNGKTIRVKMALGAKNPLVIGAPDIDLDIYLDFDWPDWAVTLTGAHDGFPAFEIYMSVDNSKPVKLYQYSTTGNGILDHKKMFPPMDIEIAPVRLSLGIPR